MVTSPPARTTGRTSSVRTRRRASVFAILVVLVLAIVAVALLWPRGEVPNAGLSKQHVSAMPAPARVPLSGRTVSVLDSGAVGDGSTDDAAALQRAFSSARRGDVVELPAGRTFAHRSVLTVTTPGITISGGGTLLATDEQHSSLVLAADDITLQDVTLRITATSKRWESYEQQRLRLDGHDGLVVRDISIDGSAAAGIYVGGNTANFLLDRVKVADTRADGIHMTQGAHDGRVVAPQVTDAGDDGVSVVSYAPDGEPCTRIEIDAPRVDGSAGGRGVSVVGGSDITYRDVDVRRTYAAGVYIATESSFDTSDVHNVVVHGGSVINTNLGNDVDHGAVLVFNGTSDKVVTDVEVSGLTIEGTRPTVSREVGLIANDDNGIAHVSLFDLTIRSNGATKSFVSDRTGTTYRSDGWNVDGRLLAKDQRGMVNR